MSKLHIQGYLAKDSDGIIGVTNKKDYHSWDVKSIPNSVLEFAEAHGMYQRYSKRLGGRKGIIEDANLHIYITDKKCSYERASRTLLEKLYGDIKTDVAYEGYSEYTITGFSLEDFSIGGHNLEYELESNIGKYIHFVLECDE